MMTGSITRFFANVNLLQHRRNKRVARHLEELLALPLSGGSFVDPERDIPIGVLNSLKSPESGYSTIHPIQRALNEIMVEGQEYAGVMKLGDIRGISATKGGTAPGTSGFHMSLDRLPETMALIKGESYGPLPVAEIDRLYDAICAEFPLRQEIVRLELQVWDGTYIALNSGASRRFALLRRLDRQRSINALIKPYSLSLENLHLLRQRWRVVVLSVGSQIPQALYSLADLYRDDFWIGDRVSKDLFLLAIPYLHTSANVYAEPLSRLHRRFDEIGVFDVGRYLTEQVSLLR